MNQWTSEYCKSVNGRFKWVIKEQVLSRQRVHASSIRCFCSYLSEHKCSSQLFHTYQACLDAVPTRCFLRFLLLSLHSLKADLGWWLWFGIFVCPKTRKPKTDSQKSRNRDTNNSNNNEEILGLLTDSISIPFIHRRDPTQHSLYWNFDLIFIKENHEHPFNRNFTGDT